jgi:tRNA-dihydrouridine synthase
MDRYRLLSSYFRSLIESEMPDAIGKMKQFATLFTHGVRNGGNLRQAVHRAHTSTEILDRVDGFFTQATASVD